MIFFFWVLGVVCAFSFFPSCLGGLKGRLVHFFWSVLGDNLSLPDVCVCVFSVVRFFFFFCVASGGVMEGGWS